MTEYLPNDSDGDALRRLEAHGSDLSKPMKIDFHVKVLDEARGKAFGRRVEEFEFEVDIWQDSAGGAWTCNCSRVMVPSYDAMIATQELLRELGEPYGATPDGWGSFGNAPS